MLSHTRPPNKKVAGSKVGVLCELRPPKKIFCSLLHLKILCLLLLSDSSQRVRPFAFMQSQALG